MKGQTTWLRTSDGVRLYAAELGTGSTALVLAHESPGGMCGWLPAMQELARRGYRALAFDFRGFAPSDIPATTKQYDLGGDLQAAVDAVRDDGAKRVFVMGASFGGAAAITFGSTLHDVTGIVNLSGELDLPTPHLDAVAQAPKLRVPLLVVASHDDPYLDAAAAAKLERAAGSQDKQLVVLPGSRHGWDVLSGPVWARIFGWLRSHSG